MGFSFEIPEEVLAEALQTHRRMMGDLARRQIFERAESLEQVCWRFMRDNWLSSDEVVLVHDGGTIYPARKDLFPPEFTTPGA